MMGGEKKHGKEAVDEIVLYIDSCAGTVVLT